MPQGPILIFDKSSLESLNLDEAVLLDNFYMSNITPLFFVECLADLEKSIRSRSTPEQLVGSLADRTPDAQACANIHHMTILNGELTRQYDLKKQLFRPLLGGGIPVQLGDKKGMIFQRSKEEEALDRWSRREFLDLERTIAKVWRQALSKIDLDANAKSVMAELGHWKTPKTLEEAKQTADTIIDNMDPEWLIGFGLELLGVPEATAWVHNDWVENRRPPLRRVRALLHFHALNQHFFLSGAAHGIVAGREGEPPSRSGVSLLSPVLHCVHVERSFSRTDRPALSRPLPDIRTRRGAEVRD